MKRGNGDLLRSIRASWPYEAARTNGCTSVEGEQPELRAVATGHVAAPPVYGSLSAGRRSFVPSHIVGMCTSPAE